MQKLTAPPSAKIQKTISDTMHHAIPRRTASREIDAVHPLGPTRVHPIHPTRPRTGQCARHGHVDHHTRFDRRPRVSHHTQPTAMWGSTNGASVPPTPTPPATARQKRNTKNRSQPAYAHTGGTWQEFPTREIPPPTHACEHPPPGNPNCSNPELLLANTDRCGGPHPNHTRQTNENGPSN